jgi:hypothetical protein
MQPNHLPLIWLKIIEQSLVRKKLIVKEDIPLLQFLVFVGERLPHKGRSLSMPLGNSARGSLSKCSYVPQNRRIQAQNPQSDRRTVFCQHTPNNRYSNQLYSHRFVPPDTKQTSESGRGISPIFSFSVERNSCQA